MGLKDSDGTRHDPFDLQRFVDAQAPVYERALAELRAGTKRTHWMWFVFPQLRGLGSSPMAHRFGISSLEETRAYLAHDVLGPRLHTSVSTALAHADRSSLHTVLGSPDDMKFISSMTLFALAGSSTDPFVLALVAFASGRRDERTIALLNDQPSQ
jgi:uncharacterized protein (DUF1810 family)